MVALSKYKSDRGIQWITVAAIAFAVLATGCSSADPAPSTAPIFGTEDTTCESASTRNEDGDEELLATVSACLANEVAAGRPVTVDLAVLSAEGDPIYHRFAYDGERILIVIDNRADEFGRPDVRASSCADIDTTDWIPEGVDCADAEHPGFPEAVR